jgi:predicted nucleic acid-binding Zn ribbon protein
MAYADRCAASRRIYNGISAPHQETVAPLQELMQAIAALMRLTGQLRRLHLLGRAGKDTTMKRQVSKRGTLQPLAPVVEQVLHQAGLGRVMLLGRLQQQWEAMVGPQIAAVTHPEGLRGRVLFVTVSDAIWLQQLTFYRCSCCRISDGVGGCAIARLHFTRLFCQTVGF